MPPIIDLWHGATRIRFDAPSRRNALRQDDVDTVVGALRTDAAQPVVLGSTDPSIFCAGADLGVGAGDRRCISTALYECYRIMVTRPGPVVAVIEGPAVGGGAQLATAADVRIVGPDARFRWVGPGHGLVIGAWVLPAIVGRGRALELMYSSRWVAADEAARIGLAADPRRDPWNATAELLDGITALDAAARGRVKMITLHAPVAEALRAEAESNSGWSGVVLAGERTAGPGTEP